MRIAAEVAAHKERRPELYCPARRCLWRTGDGSYCPRHRPATIPGHPGACRVVCEFIRALSGSPRRPLPPRGVPNPPTNRPNYTGD